MPPPKKKGGDLGKALVRSRFQGRDPRLEHRSSNHTTDLDDGYDWSKMGSVTEQSDLSDFLTTAEMAGTDFTAEKLNVQLITVDRSAEAKAREISERAAAHSKNTHRLRIPRRPPWTRKTTAEELHAAEKESFLEWRRGLAALEAEDRVIMTPYERNLEFWRQLWRVIERSDVVVQIVDARNPMLFRCADLEKYVLEVGPEKKSVLLLNKSDFLPLELRKKWGAYLDSIGVEFAFFSAKMETLKAEEAVAEGRVGRGGPDIAVSAEGAAVVGKPQDEINLDGAGPAAEGGSVAADESSPEVAEGTAAAADETGLAGSDSAPAKSAPVAVATSAAAAPRPSFEARCQLKSCGDLLTYLQEMADSARGASPGDKPPVIGMVGYPNVGKSSTVNALCAEKKVPVSSTPGRTRHFQTLELGPVTLCDCPGLVFPSFANTKAEMVCFGILPIDQLTGYIDPVEYICRTVPREALNKIYGITIILPGPGENPDRPPTAQELIDTYGFARGIKSGSGDANGPRCARILLKDYVDGKLLYCKSPPDEDDVLDKPVAPTAKPRSHTNLEVVGPAHNPRYVDAVDLDFFGSGGDRALLRDRSANPAAAAAPAQQGGKPSKKHFKGGRKEKSRRRGASAKDTAGFVTL